MKRIIFPLAVILITAAAVAVLTAPALAPATPGQGIRETGSRSEVLQGWKGEPGSGAVATMTGTKAFKNLSTAQSSGYRGLKVWCTDAAGAVTACRYQYNGSGAFLPIPDGQRIFLLTSDTAFIRFGKYSTATSGSVVLSSEKF